MADNARQWINCPLCGESDMRAESPGDGFWLVQCTNGVCPSNQIEKRFLVVDLDNPDNELIHRIARALWNGTDAFLPMATTWKVINALAPPKSTDA